MVPIRVVSVHEEHPDLSRRELHNVTRATHAAIGSKWAADLLPEHFQPNAKSVFNHAPRKERWLKQKDRMFRMGQAVAGRDTDLVFKGRLREQVLRSARNLIRAYPTRVTITMIGPAYFTLRPRSRNTAQIAREILAVSPRHDRLLGEAGDKGFNAELNRVRRSRRLRKVTTTT